MKKVIGIAVVLLLVCAVMASATSTNWILVVKASNAAFAQAGATTNIGTQTGYLDTKDTTKGEPGAANNPPAGGSLAYATSKFSDGSLGQLDFRSPITSALETKVWTICVYDKVTADANGNLPAIVNPITVKISQSTTNGQSLVYNFFGADYEYVIDAGKYGSWTFNKNNTFSATNFAQFTVPGTEFPSTVNFTVTARPVVPEPGSILALGSGLVGLIGFGIRRRR